jgi:gluconate 5-dehydrogenase
MTTPKLFDLTGRTAFITGAGGHLGTAMSAALAEAGASVIVTSRKIESARESAARLPVVGSARHHAVAMDQIDPASLERGFAQAISAAGKIDILVNNGLDRMGADWRTVTAEQFNRHLQNTTGCFLLSRMLRDHVVERKGEGSIIMIGSMYGVVGSYPDAYEGICAASPAAYHALKGGIVHLTRHLAVYWAKDNVRVNCLSPGPFPIMDSPDGAPSELVQRLNKKSPMGRMGLPEELKGPVVFLASQAASYITGQNLLVDGGWTAW